jgi:hypothetical protein
VFLIKLSCPVVYCVVVQLSSGQEAGPRAALNVAGIVPVLDALLRTHESDPALVGEICRTVHNMCSHPGSRASFAACGIPDRLRSLLGRYDNQDDAEAHAAVEEALESVMLPVVAD